MIAWTHFYSVNLCISVAPTFTKTPIDIEAPVGFSIELECTADGDPTPAITWHKDTNTITDMPDKYSISAEGHLKVRNLAAQDSGVYTCTAQNPLGRAVTRGHVTVLGGW